MHEILPCPWCHKGTVVVNGRGKVRFSCRCHECGHFINVDAQAMIATRGTALKKQARRGQGGLSDHPREKESTEN